MTSKMLVLRLLDWIFVGVTMLLVMGVAGLPIDWMLNLFDMSSPEFGAFGLFVLFASILLIHAIATSDSAP
jgi:hypothetical protein